jgi:hypothetical protein
MGPPEAAAIHVEKAALKPVFAKSTILPDSQEVRLMCGVER